jgi:ElaB/YqjD/DUF883 family membrane-anchored ribosome-binding protein
VQGGRYKNKATAMDQILKQEMTQLKEEVGEIKDTVGEIRSALMGNTYAKDGGLVGRISKAEVKIETLEKEIDELKTQHEKEMNELKARADKNDVYVKIMWTLVGMAATALVGFLLNLIFKR